MADTTDSIRAVDLPRFVRPGTAGDLSSVARYHAYVFGSRLYAMRKARKLTTGEVSNRTGVGAGLLEYYEAGTRKPGIETIIILCGALECSPNDLLLGANDKTLATGGVAMRSDEAGKQLNSK